MMGHLVLGRKDAGETPASHAKGWIRRVWQQLFVRPAAHKH